MHTRLVTGRGLARLLAPALFAAACDTADADPVASPESDTSTPELPPTETDALLAWLQRREYADWAAESEIHRSEGPHGGDVRTFVNLLLFESLDAGSAEHPVDAATVKELYDGDDVVGWAVMVKVDAGSGGATWFWYERVGTSVYADDVGEALCSGCHGAGTDQILTPFPLQ